MSQALSGGWYFFGPEELCLQFVVTLWGFLSLPLPAPAFGL